MAGIVRGRGLGVALAGVTLALTAAACTGTGGGKQSTMTPRPSPTGSAKSTVSWDLSHGHAVRQVTWHGSTSFEIGGGVKVRLRLPGGTATERVERFGADRDGGQIRNIVMYWPGTSVDDAYANAKRLARIWRLDAHNLDTWHDGLKANPGRPADLPRVIANPAGLKPTGPGGPLASVEIRYSFDTANPAMVKLQFFWRPS